MTTLIGLDPALNLSRLQKELDRFFGKPLFDLGLSGPNVFPPINVFTDKDGVVVRAEVPGFSAEQLTIAVEPGHLKISGEREDGKRTGGSYHRRERRAGKFARTLQLPSHLDIDRATANCSHGVLTIRIPKEEAAQPRQITVQAA